MTPSPWLRRLALAALLPMLSAASFVQAQNAEYFPQAQAEDFDPAIPSPEQFLGYPIGSRFTRHDRVIAYLRELAARSERVELLDLGRSYEDRELITLILTSPANHARLEQIRQAHLRQIDPEQPDASPTDLPVVAWLGYGVHGNETSGGEAALLVAYYLAAHRGTETARWLNEAVVLIDPVQNPDGRDRAVNWHTAYSSVTPVADPADKEHVEAFPGGRGNHYFTDLNRDWLAVTQRETRPKIALLQRWYPNVQLDVHEMGAGSTYYFEPSPDSVLNPLLPRASYEFNHVLARYHAKALDALGSLYFTREIFDNFAPIYGSTYPDFHGGVGVTVEQGSSRGLVQETAGGLLTFPFTVRNQLVVSLATIQGAVAERTGLQRLQRNFYTSALTQARAHRHQAFVFGEATNATLNARLLDLLLLHRIRVHALDRSIEIDGKRFEPGSAWVVPAQQPQFRLVHAFFEDTPPVKGDVFYGSTSYALAHAYGLAFAASTRALPQGAAITSAPIPRGEVIGGDATYAYVLDWRDQQAPRALQALLAQDVAARAAFQPFELLDAGGGRVAFGYGSVVIPVATQKIDRAALHARVRQVAIDAGVRFHAVSSGRTATGIDLGSNSVRPLRQPQVALVVGPGVNSTDIGSAWFVLDQQLQLPATRLDPSQLAQVPLARYTSLVLASGDYSTLPASAVEALRQWVNAGGSLVSFGSASQWVLDQKLASGASPSTTGTAAATAASDGSPRATDGEASATPRVERKDFGAQLEVQAIERVTGNILSADADITHPVAFGLGRRAVYVYKESERVLPPSDNPFSTPVRFDEALYVNGYLSERHRKRIAGSAYVVVVPVGKGTLVQFADGPTHRGHWHGTERLFLNSLLFSEFLAPTPERRGR